MLRRLIIWLVLLSAARTAAAARSGSAAEQVCRPFPGFALAYRFRTGSPPAAPPVIASDGSVYVGTREGYLHGLHADGSYHWSYTLAGPITGRPHRAPNGVLLVPTARRIYALSAEGRLIWAFDSPVRVVGDLVSTAQGRVHFASDDGRLFVLSTRGALLAHVPGSVPFSALPVRLPDGAIAAGRRDGGVLLRSAAGSERFRLDSAVTALLGCPGARFCALAGDALWAVGKRAERIGGEVSRAFGDADALAVITPQGRLELYRGPERVRAFSTALPDVASAPPVLDRHGNAYVPLKSGALFSVSSAGRVHGCVAIAASALGPPAFDEPRSRLLIGATEGLLAAVALE